MKHFSVCLILTTLLVFMAPCLAQKAAVAPNPGDNLKNNPQIDELYAKYRVDQVQLETNGVPKYLDGDLTPRLRSADPVELSYAFFDENLPLYRMVSPRNELRVKKSTVDEAGTTHLTFVQYYQDVPVFLGEIKTHVSADRRLTTVNGNYLPAISLNASPSLNASAAETRALNDMGALRSECFFGTTELFVYPSEGKTFLAWRVEVSAYRGEAWWYLIDAHSGRVLHRYTRMYDGQPRAALEPAEPETGTATIETMRLREQTPLTGADQERFLLDGQVYTRNRGEYQFQPARMISDLNAEIEQLQAQWEARARMTTYDVTLDLRNPAHWSAVNTKGYLLQPMSTDGYYHAFMTKYDTKALAELGIPLGIYPNLPDQMLETPTYEDVKSEDHHGGNLDETMLTQTFEGAFPATGWAVGDSNATNGLDYWDDVSCRSHGGTWSAWCADIGATTTCSHYDHYMKAYMRTPVVNLTGRTNCLLSFWWWNNSELDFDYFREYYSGDGIHWTLGRQSTGNEASWHNESAWLNGWTNYYELFFFYSDLSIYYEGAYVDDITITADWAPCGEIGTGTSVMGTAQSHIDVDYSGGNFRMDDRTRQTGSTCWHNHDGWMPTSASIRTHNYTSNFPTNPGSIATDADNVWSNPPAVDAQVYTGKFYDYMKSAFGRNGHTNSGANMWCTVNCTNLSNNASYWGGYVGFGTVTSGYRSMAGAPDIVAHEWGHGITDYESGLIYEKESGALNESYSDMVGTAFGFATGLDADWLHGENFRTSGVPNRDLSNPPARSQPDNYGGTYWVNVTGCTPSSSNDYCGVHTNSGVGNKFFYLLSVGGTFRGVTVTGIGIANAMLIVHRANRDYWTSTTNYADARAGCISSANAWFPAYVCNVKDAWAAVGVGDPCERPLVCTSYTTLSNGLAYNGTTVGAARNVLDYNCSTWNESGPEKVHRIVFTGPATLTVTLSNLTVDLDVFLLSSCSDAACVAYGNSSFTYAIPGAGTYYIVVDGYYGVQGTYTILASWVGNIIVNAPNGGESWWAGESRTITWSSSLTENVKIEIDRSYPSTWSTIIASTPNDGSHSWLVTGPATSNARIRVSGVTHTTVSDISNAPFTISARTVTVTAPNGGENWMLGNTYNIGWTSSGLVGENVKIELKRGYPAGIWETVIASTPNTGSYSWTIGGIASTAARIRVSGTVHTTVSDTSNANFIITSGGGTPSITVTAPNGLENWVVGTTQNITWASSSLAENVKIELNRTYPAGVWEVLTANTANDGVHPWTVAGALTTNARVRISGVVSTAVNDISNANFTISSGGGGGAITVTSPNGGEHWVIGTTQSITWSAPALSGSVKIEINRSYPAGAWIVITPSTANDGIHPWIVTPGASTTARVRISSVTTPATLDESDAGFTIASTLFMSGPGNLSGMADLDGPVPTDAYMIQNYPNPFNPSTSLEFGVPEATDVTLRVFDITGREVATLLKGEVAAGRHRVTWNCAECTAGVYLIVMQGNGFHLVQKATFLK